jgi:hypothetical protein
LDIRVDEDAASKVSTAASSSTYYWSTTKQKEKKKKKIPPAEFVFEKSMPPVQYKSPRKSNLQPTSAKHFITALAPGNGRYSKTTRKAAKKLDKQLREEAEIYTQLIKERISQRSTINAIYCNDNMGDSGGFNDDEPDDSMEEEFEDEEDDGFDTLPFKAMDRVQQSFSPNDISESEHAIAATRKLINWSKFIDAVTKEVPFLTLNDKITEPMDARSNDNSFNMNSVLENLQFNPCDCEKSVIKLLAITFDGSSLLRVLLIEKDASG